jgi:hypothetical protein
LCRTEKGCPIPPLRPEAQRIMEIRGLLESLHGLVDPGTICRIYRVESDDLLLLAAYEDELKRCLKEPEQDDE